KTAQDLVRSLQAQRNELRLTEQTLLNSLPDERRREFALQLAEMQNEQVVPTGEAPADNAQLSPVLKGLLQEEGQRGTADSAEKHFLTASALQTDNKYAEALKEFDASIRADPKYSRAYVGKALVENRLGRYQDAINDCNKAIALEHDNA